jgi:MFS family permease
MDTTRARPAATRPRLVSRPLALVFVAAFGAMATFYLLLPVVPGYAEELGGRSAAGFSTGAMMLATVLLDPVVPALLRRFGNRVVIGAGLVLLGVPALALAATPGLPAVLAACFLRGAGLAVLVVAGTALTAALAPPSRRGQAMGLYGLVAGVPGVLCMPLGVWVADRAGEVPVFVAGGVVALLALVAVPGLPARTAAGPGGPHRSREAVAAVVPPMRGGLVRPALAFAATTFAAGVVPTFLPLAVPDRLTGVAAIGLLVLSVLAPLTRWAAGHWDRRLPPRLVLGPSLLVCAAGIGLLAAAGSVAAVVAGAALFGLGFGVAQTASLLLMLDAVPAGDYDRASALWNLAYDAGLGLGAVVFGLVAGPLGYSAGFALTAVVLLIALPAARPHRRKEALG